MSEAQTHKNGFEFLDLSDDGYVLLDEKGEASAASLEASRMLGFAHKDMLGQRIGTLIKNDRSGSDVVELALRANKREDIFVIGQNGRHLLFSLRYRSSSSNVSFV